MGIRGKPHDWVKSYLSKRTQIIITPVARSDPIVSKMGVPQGSILGPLFFVIFVSDIANYCKSSQRIIQYADDTNILMSNSHFEQVVDSSNKASYELHQYCNENGLLLNVEKTYFMRYLPKNIIPNFSPYLHINGISIKSVDNIKFLGITLDTKLSWEAHIDNTVSKLSTHCFIIKNLRETVSWNVLLLIYYGLVQSTLQYGLLFWGPSAYFYKAFNAQKKVIRALYNLTPTTSCRKFFRDSEILTLPCLYIYLLISYINNRQSIFEKNENIHSYNTRQKSSIHQPFSRLKIAQHSPKYIGIKCYNKFGNILNTQHGNGHGVKSFKNELYSFLLQHNFYSVDEFLNFK